MIGKITGGSIASLTATLSDRADCDTLCFLHGQLQDLAGEVKHSSTVKLVYNVLTV